MNKSELVLKQVFNIVGYHCNLSQGPVKPTREKWHALTKNIQTVLGDHTRSVWQFMFLIGLLTATKKRVISGSLHVTLIQWHLKNH